VSCAGTPGATAPAGEIPSAADESPAVEALRAGARRVVEGYIAAVNAGDAERALTYYAPDATLRLASGQIVRGSESLRQIEAFHAVVRPRQVPMEPSYRVAGTRTYVSFARVREYSKIFTAIGMPFVTTEPATDAFVVEADRIVAIQVADFIAPCRAIMGAAMSGARSWLERRADSRLTTLRPGGVPKVDASTGALWVTVLREWRAATGWEPDVVMREACAAP